MNVKKPLLYVVIGFISASFLMPNNMILGQENLKCGDIVEDEFRKFPEMREFTIDMTPGDKLEVVGRPIGESLSFTISIWDSGGKVVGYNAEGNGYWLKVSNAPVASSTVLSSRGTYEILLGNGETQVGSGRKYFDVVGFSDNGGVGSYELLIRCTLRDGTVIEPGDTAPAPDQNGSNTNVPVAPTFSGNGFPGLAPIDFSNVAKIPMIANVPMTGGVAPDGSNILGYTVDANANDTLALGFSRLSGNLNLGLVVLSADNKVVFQASLVTSSELTTKFTLPTAGTYTIGIFRIDLLPPTAPEATAFQLTATLNP